MLKTMTARDESLKTFNNTLPFFEKIDEAERDILLNVSHSKRYDKKTTLFLQGDPAHTVFFIISGWVKLYNITENGEETINAVLQRGGIIGDTAIFGSKTYSSSACVLEDAEIIGIPVNHIRKRVMLNPVLATHIMTLMTHKMVKTTAEKGILTTMDSQQRLSCLLLRLSSWMKGKGGTFALPYDKSVMALQLGMQPETFSRTMSRLEEHGVKNGGSEVEIQNFLSLCANCCTSCTMTDEQCDGRRIPPVSVTKKAKTR